MKQEKASGSGISRAIYAGLHLTPHRQPRASTPPLSFFTGRMPFLPPNQRLQSTEVALSALMLLVEWQERASGL